MTIRVRFPKDAVDRVEFIVSPFLETFWSLHVLQVPERHTLSQNMIREARRETEEFRRDLGRFAFAFRGSPTALGIPFDGRPGDSFDDALARARCADAAAAALFFTRSFYIGMEPISRDGRVPALVAERFLAHARGVRASVELAETALTDPRAVLAEFLDLLERYWRVSFGARWPDYSRWHGYEIEGARARIQRGFRELLRHLPVDVRLDLSGDGFVIDRPHDHEVVIGPRDRIVLTPTFMVWPHVRVSCERPGIFGLAFANMREMDRLAPVPPPEELLSALEAIADDTRLRVLRYLNEVPRSTQELATLVAVTVPTMSEHLRKLEAAGIVRRRREGHFVVYEPVLDMGDLLERLHRYLDFSTDMT